MKKLYTVLALLLLSYLSFGQSSGPAPRIPGGNLDKWYPFCTASDVLDRTMTGFDLISTAVSATTDRFGQNNKAYSFNGATSEMHYSTYFPIPLFGVSEFTYSCYIYPVVAQDAIILYNGNPTVDGLGFVMNNGVLGGGPGNQVALLFGASAEVLATPVTLNAWHHLLVTRNGNSYIFYVDGVSVGFYIPPTPPGYTNPTTVFQLGLNYTAGNKPFNGKIDDVAIYSRQLSAVEVVKLKDFNPDIIFTLGPDTSIVSDTLLLATPTRVDTVKYPNRIYTTSSNPDTFNYSWNTSSLATTNKVGFIPATPQAPITRSLTISRYLSCPTTDAIIVSHIVPVINLGNDTTFCVGDTLRVGPASSPYCTYHWNTGATTARIPITGSGSYALVMDSMVISGLDTSYAHATDTINVTVTPAIHVTLPADDTLCQGGTYPLFSSDSYIAPTYVWSDPLVTGPVLTVTTTGCYWLEVHDQGCIRRDTSCITILYDTVTLYSVDTQICVGATIVANASSNPSISYQWRPTSGIPVSTVSTPTITPDTSAWYVLTASIYTCHVSDSFYIDVQPYPLVKMGGNRSVCQYDSIRITPSVTPTWYTHYSYDWTPGTFLDDSTSSYAVFNAGDTTKIVLTVSTPAGCSNSDSIIVNTYHGDFASMSTDTSLCPGDTVVLMPTSTEPGITTYVWHPSMYVNDTNATNPVIKPESSMYYHGIATSQYGCHDTLFYRLTVFPNAVITMDDSAVLFPGETYQFSPITNGTHFSWTPDVGLSDTSISNPVANPPVNTKYILTVRTEDGCKAIDSTSIRVMDHSIIQVPNGFVPGGVSGPLKVILRGLARLRYFRIYDRWGNIVFDAKNIEDGWDGTFNGKPQPAGVYIFEAEAATSTGQILRKQGNVTLLR